MRETDIANLKCNVKTAVTVKLGEERFLGRLSKASQRRLHSTWVFNLRVNSVVLLVRKKCTDKSHGGIKV